jgi:hypothetical protein
VEEEASDSHFRAEVTQARWNYSSGPVFVHGDNGLAGLRYEKNRRSEMPPDHHCRMPLDRRQAGWMKIRSQERIDRFLISNILHATR